MKNFFHTRDTHLLKRGGYVKRVNYDRLILHEAQKDVGRQLDGFSVLLKHGWSILERSLGRFGVIEGRHPGSLALDLTASHLQSFQVFFFYGLSRLPLRSKS